MLCITAMSKLPLEASEVIDGPLHKGNLDFTYARVRYPPHASCSTPATYRTASGLAAELLQRVA